MMEPGLGASGKLEAGGYTRRWLMIGKGPVSHWTVTIALLRPRDAHKNVSSRQAPVFKWISDEREEKRGLGARS